MISCCFGLDLEATKPILLHIPRGYANRFKALEPNARVIIFSVFVIQQPANDGYRSDQNKWFNSDDSKQCKY